jgi:hypothetical protein
VELGEAAAQAEAKVVKQAHKEFSMTSHRQLDFSSGQRPSRYRLSQSHPESV